MNTVPAWGQPQAGLIRSRICWRAAVPLDAVHASRGCDALAFQTTRAPSKAQVPDAGFDEAGPPQLAMAPHPLSSMRPFSSEPNKSRAFDGGIQCLFS
jgi:hypothetical protein